jgi:hypothetical protein
MASIHRTGSGVLSNALSFTVPSGGNIVYICYNLQPRSWAMDIAFANHSTYGFVFPYLCSVLSC